MFTRLALAALFALSLAACASVPEDGEEKDDTGRDSHCTTERDLGSRKPVKVCR